MFAIFSSLDGKFHFRFSDKTGILFTSEEGFDTRDACISAISLIKEESLLAPSIFARFIVTVQRILTC